LRSSSGLHFIGLDHVRALAVLMVFAWHFTHATGGYPGTFEGAPAVFPLALFDEGHTGVALFMVLSGYLFAKLLDGKSISYAAFFWNRLIRLAPLLVLVLVLVGISRHAAGESLGGYVANMATGFVVPAWPNGAWSITVEMHFYIALPLLIYLSRRRKWAPVVFVAAAIALRSIIFLMTGEVEYFAYYTIIGRIDQFALGITAFSYRRIFAGRHLFIVGILAAFTVGFWTFDFAGGYYGTERNPLWIILPTAEAVAYSSLIAYYDTSFRMGGAGISWAFSKIGEYSYSIYLLHTFFVFQIAEFIQRNVMDISNFYVALAWSFACFTLMIPVAVISFTYVEAPFLRLRRVYTKPNTEVSLSTAGEPMIQCE
jgi:peptidoglycan/LPS O-acetylase OafA/YrhL